jgi:hypothetical protein
MRTKILAFIVSMASTALFSTGALAYTFDKEVPGNIQQQMAQDLDFVTTIQGVDQSALHKEIFTSVSGPGYKSFFENRIEAIGFDGCGNGNAVACVYPYRGKKMFITNNYIKFSHPAIARLMVVFHEARHTEYENDNWPHETCPTPFLDADGSEIHSIWTGAVLAGEAACDITPFGSYGSSTIMMKNISKFCTNCNEKVKMDAGIYADDQFKRITDPGAKSQMLSDLYGSK